MNVLSKVFTKIAPLQSRFFLWNQREIKALEFMGQIHGRVGRGCRSSLEITPRCLILGSCKETTSHNLCFQKLAHILHSFCYSLLKPPFPSCNLAMCAPSSHSIGWHLNSPTSQRWEKPTVVMPLIVVAVIVIIGKNKTQNQKIPWNSSAIEEHFFWEISS